MVLLGTFQAEEVSIPLVVEDAGVSLLFASRSPMGKGGPTVPDIFVLLAQLFIRPRRKQSPTKEGSAPHPPLQISECLLKKGLALGFADGAFLENVDECNYFLFRLDGQFLEKGRLSSLSVCMRMLIRWLRTRRGITEFGEQTYWVGNLGSIGVCVIYGYPF